MTPILLAIWSLALGQTNGQPSRAGAVNAVEKPEVRVITLKNERANDASAILSHALDVGAPGSYYREMRIVAGSKANTLVVVSPQRQIEGVCEVISELDRAAKPENGPNPFHHAWVDTTVFLAAVPDNAVMGLSSAKLEEAAQNVDGLSKMLTALGKTRILRRGRERIMIDEPCQLKTGSSVPFLRGTQMVAKGQTNSQIEYQDIGCKLTFERGRTLEKGGEILASIEVSALSDSNINVGNNTNAPVFNKFNMRYAGPFMSGKPIVIWATNPQGPADAVSMCIARIVLTREP